jgi:outer membrane protein assembly factor BamB
MKKLIQFFIPVSILIFSVFWLSGFSVQSVQTNLFGNEDSSTVENADSVSIDMTEFYIKLNSDPKTKPSESFRPGHVTPRQIDNYLKKTDYGYVITMGSYTNVPTPVVKDGTVYVSGGFGSKQFYAFDALSGQNIWAINLDDDGPSSPAVEDSIIVFNTESCTIFACNIKTGEHLWSYWLGDPLMCMPTIANGIVFTSYPAGYNGQLNLNQNINMQQNDFNISGNASMLNDSTVSMNTSHVFIAMDLYTGKILWQSRIDGDVMSAPVAKDDYIYATTFPGTLFQFEQKNR